MPNKKVDVLSLEGEIRNRGYSIYILSKGNQDDDGFYIDDYSLLFDKICVCPVANMVCFKNSTSYITIGNIEDIEIADYPCAYMCVITIVSVNTCNNTKNKYKILAKSPTQLY